MALFRKLPDHIKDVVAGIESVELITNILTQTGLPETARPLLNDIIYGLFIGELAPHLLLDAIKEELRLDDTKAELVGALVKKSFVEPNIDFLTRLYQNIPKQNPAQNPNSVPPENVVNLKRSA